MALCIYMFIWVCWHCYCYLTTKRMSQLLKRNWLNELWCKPCKKKISTTCLRRPQKLSFQTRDKHKRYISTSMTVPRRHYHWDIWAGPINLKRCILNSTEMYISNTKFLSRTFKMLNKLLYVSNTKWLTFQRLLNFLQHQHLEKLTSKKHSGWIGNLQLPAWGQSEVARLQQCVAGGEMLDTFAL